MNSIRIDGRGVTLMLHTALGEPPRILHWGKMLSDDVTPKDVMLLSARKGGPGSADVYITPSLALEPGIGLLGPSGFTAHRAGRDWGSRFVVQSVTPKPDGVVIVCNDPGTLLQLDYDIVLDPDTDILKIQSSVTNQGGTVLDLVDMATACLPVPQHMSQIIGFNGRWTDEFRRERIDRFTGGYVRENRRGRTSHDSFPAIIVCEDATTETAGEAYGLHLAWSGNHRVRVDTLNNGEVIASLGALLLPGEVRLEPGERYDSPQIVAGYSDAGLTLLSQRFHAYIRSKVLRPATRVKPRPVHYNTWEAVYFDHDITKLKAIADAAAEIGAERFVLDDGWFGARRNDQAGLGDWTVSADVYPGGLGPLIDHVTGLGMEMGIWFEPEMVNPDSDLYRAHPDWALRIEGIEQVPFRNQYVLDISRPEISDYLFTRIDAILSEYDIGYIKWDMNRDLNHPGDAQGYPRAFAQVPALYALIDRIRAAHPGVEVETCSSGGARPDYGILAHTDRIWTSDSNDALDRQSIQRGASFFLPLDVLGAHVGPRHCHATGRTLPMAMRAATALFGHMGMELNLLTEPERDLVELKSAIALYKEHRALLHNGDFLRADTPDFINMVGVVAVDRGEALYSVAVLTAHVATVPPRIRFDGLNAGKHYRIRQIWPQNWRSRAQAIGADTLQLIGEGSVVPGDALRTFGLQLPLADPQTVFLFHITQVIDRANH
jgi:alpha-galactosidase